MEDENQPRIKLNKKKLSNALLVMYNKHPHIFARLKSGDWDGVDGDSLLQLMAFGELKYG